MTISISQKYLDALKAIDGWTTVSEWAVKVGEVFPDVLEKANRDAQGQKNETTGLREIAARISSNISRGAYIGLIEIDESERPRKVRVLTEIESENYEQKEMEDDLAPITRGQRIKADEDKLSVKEMYRITEMANIIDQLRSFFSLDFEFEHAKAILNPTDPGKHHPDNIQLLLKSHNRIKGKNNWDRFTVQEQIEYIQAAVNIQKIVSKKMNIDLEEEVIDQIITRLKLVY